ncbi:unnamed protein product [Chrysoparadoxa australica]
MATTSRVICVAAFCSFLCLASAFAFTLTTHVTSKSRARPRSMLMSAAPGEIAALGLTPELERLVKAFRSMPDDKMRYKQLLFMAAQGKELEEADKTTANKVQGCLSTVYVVADYENGVVNFRGDSDAQLTKGLVNILIRGLSGNSPADIQTVQPDFIRVAGLQTSLTPGRNNGFINMLSTMKAKALEAEAACSAGSAGDAAQAADEAGGANAGGLDDEVDGKPMTSAIKRKLASLKPLVLEVEDESGDEQKFYIRCVSEAFAGLGLVKRHQLVHTVIAEEMQQIHAVVLNTKTPSEVGM